MPEVTTTGEKHRCRSRDQNPQADQAFPGDDDWRVLPNGDRTCSFCGSLHPEDFKRLVERAMPPDGDVDIEPSTKAYKIYVRQPQVANASEGGIKFYRWHAPDEAWIRDMDGEAACGPYPTAVVQSRRRFAKQCERPFTPPGPSL